MNRYVFVLNNPLRFVDPVGLEEKDPWSQLTGQEQNLISQKLILTGDKTAQEVFNNLVTVKGDAQQTAVNVASVQNFLAAVGASKNSEVWQQIAFVEKVNAQPGGRPAPDVVQSSTIEVTVREKGAFLDALGNAGFSVNSKRDEIVAWIQGDKTHPFDNAREITKWAKDPEMHFVNDKSDQPRYGPNWFFFHWDRTSSHTWLSGVGEEKEAGEKHKLGFASPERVRDYLKRERKAPQQ